MREARQVGGSGGMLHFRHSEMVSGAIWQIVRLVVHMDPARLW